MKKYILFALLAITFVACHTNNPEHDDQLIGTWSEVKGVKSLIWSLTFTKEGALIWIEKTDTTLPSYLQVAPRVENMHYSIIKNQLCIYGDTLHFGPSLNNPIPFMYMTDYSIEGVILTIDSFSLNGGISEPFQILKLEKQ